MMLHKSSSRFSSGVPVSASLCSALSALAARATIDSGVFDVLRLVQDDGAEGEFLQGGEIAAQQRVVGDDEIVRGNFLAQAVAMFTRGEQQHFLAGRELRGLAVPVEDNAGRANDEARPRPVLLAQMLEPGEGLHRFAESHVVGEERAQLEARGIGEEMEPGALVRTQLGDEPLRQGNFGQALEVGDRLAQLRDDCAAHTIDQRLEFLPGGLLRARHLPGADLLLARAHLHADLRQRADRLGHRGDFLALHPDAVGKFYVRIVILVQARPVGVGHRQRFVLPRGLDAEPVDAGGLNLELGEAAALAADEVLEAAIGEVLPLRRAVLPMLEQGRDARGWRMSHQPELSGRPHSSPRSDSKPRSHVRAPSVSASAGTSSQISTSLAACAASPASSRCPGGGMHDHLRRRHGRIAVLLGAGQLGMGRLRFGPAVVDPLPRQLALARVGLEADLQCVVLVEMEIELHLRRHLAQMHLHLLLQMRIAAQQRRQQLAGGGDIDRTHAALERQRHERTRGPLGQTGRNNAARR